MAVSTKMLVTMVRKWKRLTAMGRKRISIPSSSHQGISDNCNTQPSGTPKGHFAVYSIEKKRFVIPLSYLNNEIVCALFDKSEEEYGLSSDGHIILPIDSRTMEYLISLIRRGLAKEQNNALLLFVASVSCSSSLITSTLDRQIRCQPMSVCS